MRLTDEQVAAAVTELYKVTRDAEAAQAVALDKTAAAARLASSLHDLMLAEGRLRVLPGGQAS